MYKKQLSRSEIFKMRKMSASQLMALGGKESLTKGRQFILGAYKTKYENLKGNKSFGSI